MKIKEYLFNRYVALFVLVVIGMVVLLSINNLVETNNSGYYQMKQAFYTGNMTSRTTPGTYGQLLGKITTYKISDMIWFSNNIEEGGKGIEANPVEVQFSDGSKALISGALKIKLSLKKQYQLKVHEDFVSYRPLLSAIRKHLEESLQNAATVMRAEDVYSARRSEFGALARQMTEKGIYQTITEMKTYVDLGGKKVIEKVTKINTDKNGIPIVLNPSPLQLYDISVVQFTIKGIQFDKTIDMLIAKKKEAEQAKVVAQADTEKAKQNAIKEVEEGKARVARAEYNALEKKRTAVIDAEMKTELATQAKLQAFEVAAAKRKSGEAEAYAAKLKVSAGLTPQERALINKDTSIGVARELAKIKLPSTMVISGGNGNGKGGNQAMDPFTAVGLKQFIDISKTLSTGK